LNKDERLRARASLENHSYLASMDLAERFRQNGRISLPENRIKTISKRHQKYFQPAPMFRLICIPCSKHPNKRFASLISSRNRRSVEAHLRSSHHKHSVREYENTRESRLDETLLSESNDTIIEIPEEISHEIPGPSYEDISIASEDSQSNVPSDEGKQTESPYSTEMEIMEIVRFTAINNNQTSEKEVEMQCIDLPHSEEDAGECTIEDLIQDGHPLYCNEVMPEEEMRQYVYFAPIGHPLRQRLVTGVRNQIDLVRAAMQSINLPHSEEDITSSTSTGQTENTSDLVTTIENRCGNINNTDAIGIPIKKRVIKMEQNMQSGNRNEMEIIELNDQTMRETDEPNEDEIFKNGGSCEEIEINYPYVDVRGKRFRCTKCNHPFLTRRGFLEHLDQCRHSHP
jgi:hypothetical protein